MLKYRIARLTLRQEERPRQGLLRKPTRVKLIGLKNAGKRPRKAREDGLWRKNRKCDE